ncbi:MAG: hypothetical protein ABIQ95_01460, partial [Bdellovibrionia bacterium]
MTKYHWFFKILFLFHLTVLFYSFRVLAYDSSVLGSRYTSARLAGMGGQPIGLENEGGGSLFYNPALISKSGRYWNVESNAAFYGSGSFFNINGFEAQNYFRLESQATNLLNNPGIYSNSGWAYLADVSVRGLTFGLLVQEDSAAQAYDENLIYYSTKFQFIPSIGMGVHLIKDILRLGYSLQWINQASGKKEVPGNSAKLGFAENLMQGSGFSHTLGLEFSSTWRFISKFNVVARNIFGLNFGPNCLFPFTNRPQGTPTGELMMIDANLGGRYKIKKGGFVRYSVGINDVLGVSQVPLEGRLGVGIEMALSKHLNVRAGWDLGYPTLGFDFDLNSGTHTISMA